MNPNDPRPIWSGLPLAFAPGLSPTRCGLGLGAWFVAMLASAVVFADLPQVNERPSFVPGTSGLRGHPGELTSLRWATELRPGPPAEAGQKLVFLVENSAPELFEVQPAVDPRGWLRFAPRLEALGRATVSIRLQDDGGTSNGGRDTSEAVEVEIEIGCFEPALTAPLELNLSFTAPLLLAVPGGFPQSASLADLDGDGRNDVLSASPDGSAFLVFRNVTPTDNANPVAAFEAAVAFGVAASPPSLALGDLDGDGLPEVITNPHALEEEDAYRSQTVGVYRNRSLPGALDFDPPLILPNRPETPAGVTTDVAVGDLDRDGRLDLAVANPGDGVVACYRNTTEGGVLAFAARVEVPAGSLPTRLAIGDIDGDGRPDLIASGQNPDALTLLRNTSSPGAISFAAPPVSFPAPAGLGELVVADVDRDGKYDIAAAAPGLDGILVWRNTALVGALSAAAPASLAAPQFVATGCGPRSLAVAELDGDGYPDFAVANFEQDTLSILGNLSEPGVLRFASRGEFPTGRGPFAVALGDVDGDQRPDVGLAEIVAGQLHVRQNRSTRGIEDIIRFTVGGGAGPVEDLVLTASSSNEGLIPNGNLSIEGNAAERRLVVTARPGVSGVSRITVRVEDADGQTVENEVAVLVGCTLNTVWPAACALGLAADADGALHASIQQSLDQAGEGRWYRFQVQPESQLFVILSSLPANYDLFVFQDIQAAYDELEAETLEPEDLAALNARYAPAAYSPAAYSPAAYSPMVYSPAAYSPAAYSPAAYSPMAYSPAAYSPAAYSPAAYSPAAYSPAAYSADAFSPAAYSPAAYSGPADAPVAFSPAAYSGAQTRSLLAASAFDGNANEGIYMNTWTSTGDFYICVRGREGAFLPNEAFRLDVHLVPGGCGGLDPDAIPPSTTVATPGPGAGYRTLILADFDRLNRLAPPDQVADWAADIATLRARLDTFVARPEVQGVVVDLGTDAALVAANQQADDNFDCVFAKNVVANLARDIVERFRALNPLLEYIVLIGNDQVIPNFRYPDNTPLGIEQNFIVPVGDATASQATLRLNYFMSQDAYGAPCQLQQKLTPIPLPLLGVGRLVEAPREIDGQLDAYLALPGGRLPQPTSSLVTGYEFLVDVATAIHDELRAGMGEGQGQVHDALVAPVDVSPQADPETTENWSASELAQILFARRHDLIFLAGHYNDGSALAADYVTELSAREVAESATDFLYSLVFGAGCHVGYNTVDAHAIPNVTQKPDWAQTFAQKRATLIGGWGYQYGDTELLEYSERLYLKFTEQLRRSPIGAAVPVGKALVAAKREYLETTDDLRGIHEKAVLQVALFGLPMLQVDLPNKREAEPAPDAIVTSTTPFITDPGATLGLKWADAVVPTGPLAERARLLGVYNDNGERVGDVTATYLQGTQGNSSQPGEPVLPLIVKDVTSPTPPDVLRGVGFRGGTYQDQHPVRQLTGTPATEFRGASFVFQALAFHPVQPWQVNYFGALCSLAGNLTRLNLYPAQYRTDPFEPELGTRRVFSEMGLRLYYSGNTTTYTDPSGGNPDTPALADAPTIVQVSDHVTGNVVALEASVVGNPAAGIQEVWVTYTAEAGAWHGQWQALDLAQDALVSSRWTGSLVVPDGTEPADVRYAVHAVNGIGLVTMEANRGVFFTPGARQGSPLPTRLTLDGFPLAGDYGDTATCSAVLASSEGPVPGQAVQFGLGVQRAQGFTDVNGRATVSLQLQGLPAAYTLQVTFGGTPALASASASTRFEIQRQPTRLELEDLTQVRPNLNVVAVLIDEAGHGLAEKPVFFVLTDSENVVRLARSVATDYAGRAALGVVPLAADTYTLRAFFNDRVPLPPDSSAGPELIGTQRLDPRYEPATQTGVYHFALVAVDSTIFRATGRLAKIEIARLLAASRGLAGTLSLLSVQDAQPAGATVTIEGEWIVYSPAPDTDGPGGFTYTIGDLSEQTATGTVQVLLLPPDANPTLNILLILELPDGSMLIRFIGIPGLEYLVQAKDSLDAEVPWVDLATVVAGPNGEFEYTDHTADDVGMRYYRAVGP